MAESTLPHRDAVDAFVDRVETESLDAVQRLYLFGSVAHGVHRPDSDVDIFVVVDDRADVSAVEEQLRDVAYDVMLERGATFSIHAVSDTAGCKSVTNFAAPGRRISSRSYSRQYESTLERRGDHPFFRTVLDEGEQIYG